jgi:hypothetical protein
MRYLVASALLLIATAVSVGAAVERTAGDLRLDMTVARASYQIGESVAVSMRVVNATSAPIEITLTGFAYDVLVRQRGALVWQWSHDKAAPQVVMTEQLAPGAALTYGARWDQRDLQGRQVEAGTYEITCLFLGRSRQVTPPVDVGPVRIAISR